MSNDEFIWAKNAEEYDSYISKLISLKQPKALSTLEDNKYLPLLQSNIINFIKYYKGNRILIKTSTSGKRPKNHEISDFLLEFVASTITKNIDNAEIILADGPVYSFYSTEVKRLGWTHIVDKYNLKCIDLNDTEKIKLYKTLEISEVFLKSDVVINLSKAKTHHRFGISCGYKSLLGVIVNKKNKTKLDGLHGYVPFILNKIVQIGPPIFSIVDGIDGIEGNGPLKGNVTKSNFICYGEDPFTTDVIAAIEMGFDPALIPLLIKPIDNDQINNQVELTYSRISEIDFIPSFSYRWLYRSYRNRNRRDIYYSRLLNSMIKYWDN